MAIAKFVFPQHEKEENEQKQDTTTEIGGDIETVDIQKYIYSFLEENNIVLSDEEILQIATNAIMGHSQENVDTHE